MPTFRGIDVSLQSQFDALKIPEYLPGSMPISEKQSPQSGGSFSSLKISPSNTTIRHTPPSVDLSIPAYPGSQFWICYACTPPALDSGIRYFYFKILCKGECIASWGVGQRQDWCGKTMFVLRDGGKDGYGDRIKEKQGFFFPPFGYQGDLEGAFLELQVFRAKARRRDVVRYENLQHPATAGGNLRLTPIGTVKKGEPQRMYEYALKDPIDRPFVTIRYSCRTNEQLDELDCTASEPPTPPPHSNETSPSNRQEPQPDASEEKLSAIEPHPAHRLTRKLSFPPSQQFVPSSSTNEPSSPQKQQTPSKMNTNSPVDNNFSTAAASDDVFVSTERTISRHDWATETLSPVEPASGEFVGMGLLSPPKKTRKGSKSLLSGLVASATRRRGARSTTPESSKAA
ncbi:hypothetical protein MBLNU230_g0161t1 [Neophaeotheca triangularis]